MFLIDGLLTLRRQERCHSLPSQTELGHLSEHPVLPEVLVQGDPLHGAADQIGRWRNTQDPRTDGVASGDFLMTPGE